ncbi:MAG: hypothetical protein JNJ83_05150 [Verrucomicrobiaceae bacterium]|nr:hypothetical protein [Verrucomicrobiaceae bacterium]
MKTTVILFTFVASAYAGPRTSANYRILTDTANAGGQRTTSLSYTNTSSAGGMVGTSTAPAQTAKSGYIAQLTEATTLQLTASPTSVNEGTTRQLSASLLNDDLTTTSLLASAVTWSVQSGPLISISTGGLASADIVYEDTTAVAHCAYGGVTGTLDLTVLNVSNDDLPGYSGDGLDDSWQFQYFGLNNPLAIPTADPDFDGQDNLFEFTAGLIPNSSSSRFIYDSKPVPGVPGQMRIIINPRLPDRTYTVVVSPTLGASAVWSPLTTFTINDNGNTRTITDTSATGQRKFYRVEITNP